MYQNTTLLDGASKYDLNDIRSDWVNLPSSIQGLLVLAVVVLVAISITLIVLQIIGLWKSFKKAGQPAWAAVVPFYNLFIIVKITGLELWWLALVSTLILSVRSVGTLDLSILDTTTISVFANTINWGAFFALFSAFAFINYKVAKSFGKTLAFAVGLTLMPPVFWFLLGHSKEIKYSGPDGPYKIKYPTARKT